MYCRPKDREVIKECLNLRREIYKTVDFCFAYPKVPLGSGDAVRKAKDFIEGEPFPDGHAGQLPLLETPATKQLLDAYKNDRKKNGNLCFMEDISMDENLYIRGSGRTIFMPGLLEYMTREYI